MQLRERVICQRESGVLFDRSLVTRHRFHQGLGCSPREVVPAFKKAHVGFVVDRLTLSFGPCPTQLAP